MRIKDLPTASGVTGGDYFVVDQLISGVWTTRKVASADLISVVRKLYIFVEDQPFSADGTGAADSTSAIQAAINYASSTGGDTVWFTPGHTYKVTSRLTVPSNVTLMSDGTATISVSAVNFNNSDATSPARYGSNAVVVDLSGLTVNPYTVATNNGVVGLKIVYDRAGNNGNLCVQGIVARNTTASRVRFCELSGFPVGCGIKVASVIGCDFDHNYIHDFYDNNTWSSPTLAQITGIEVDNDAVNGIYSYRNSICKNRIVNIQVGATSISGNGGYQTDGINIANKNSYGNTVSDNYIDTVGEGIDCFGNSNEFVGNRIYNTYNFALKCIHGAQYNNFTGGIIKNFGLAAIVCAGSSTAGQPTQFNKFSNISGVTGDYLGHWSANSSAGILIQPNGGTVGNNGQSKENTFDNILIDQGANCKYGVLDLGDGPRNIVKNFKLVKGSSYAKYYLSNGGSTTGYVTLVDSTKARAYLSSAQVISAGAGVQTKILLDTVEYDYRSEFDTVTNNRWTCQVSGNYKFDAMLSMSNLAAGELVRVEVLKNGAQKCASYSTAVNTGNNSGQASGEFACVEGDYVELYASQVTAWGGSRSVVGNSAFTYLCVTAA